MSCNKEKCPCTYNCPRNGKCCECLANHRGRGEFPACFFTSAGEKTYDRSFKALTEDRRKNG